MVPGRCAAIAAALGSAAPPRVGLRLRVGSSCSSAALQGWEEPDICLEGAGRVYQGPCWDLEGNLMISSLCLQIHL